MQPAYDKDEFIIACLKKDPPPKVLRGAMDTARSDFNLNTQNEVLGFVGNGGLEKPKLINVKPWGNNPAPELPIFVDAYSFFSGAKYGYIAFLYQPLTKIWIIKSFKNNRLKDTRNLAFKDSLTKMINANLSEQHHE